MTCVLWSLPILSMIQDDIPQAPDHQRNVTGGTALQPLCPVLGYLPNSRPRLDAVQVADVVGVVGVVVAVEPLALVATLPAP